MPYITENERDEKINHGGLCHSRKELAEAMAEFATNGGQLNYMISKTISEWLSINGLCYTNCQTIMGMLEILKSEFIANVITPYEELKSTENTDGIYNWTRDEINNKWNDHLERTSNLHSKED